MSLPEGATRCLPTNGIICVPDDANGFSPSMLTCITTVAGNIVVTPAEGGSDVTIPVPAGLFEVPFMVRQLKLTNTTATATYIRSF